MILHNKVLLCSKNHKYFYVVELYGAMVRMCSWNVTDKKCVDYFTEKLLK